MPIPKTKKVPGGTYFLTCSTIGRIDIFTYIEFKKTHTLNLLKFVGERKSRQKYQVWQHKNYPEWIETEAFFLEKLNYIHNNPVSRGFVELPEHWVYSSARNYILGDSSILRLEPLE